MGNNADFGCSGGCGSVSAGGSPALLTTLVQNGTTINLQGSSNILLAANHTYLVEYNADFTTPSSDQMAFAQLTLNGNLIPGSQTTSFPTQNLAGENITSVSGGVIFMTPMSPDPSIMQLLGFPPDDVTGANFNAVNIRVVDLGFIGDPPTTGNRQ